MVTQPSTPHVDIGSMEADGEAPAPTGSMFKSQLALQPLESDMLALNIRPVGPDSKYNIHEIPSVDGKKLYYTIFLRILWFFSRESVPKSAVMTMFHLHVSEIDLMVYMGDTKNPLASSIHWDFGTSILNNM